jgi:hypothetical protein
MIKKGDYFLFILESNIHWGKDHGIIILCTQIANGCVFGVSVSPPNGRIISQEERPFEGNFGNMRHLERLP